MTRLVPAGPVGYRCPPRTIVTLAARGFHAHTRRVMTINVLRGRVAQGTVGIDSLPIGETDRDIFNCVTCLRPLATGTRRCPGCRTRFAIGVPFQKASIFTGLGVLAGIAVGSLLTSLVVPGSRPAAAPGDAGVIPVASVQPARPATPTTAPAPAVPGIPSRALSALNQTATMNARLAAAVPGLAAALAEEDLDSVAVARILRAMAADAAYGAQATAGFAGWSEADGLALGLVGFYESVGNAARDGLSAALRNDTAYRAAAVRMLEVFGTLEGLDAAGRGLAAEAGVTLPPVSVP